MGLKLGLKSEKIFGVDDNYMTDPSLTLPNPLSGLSPFVPVTDTCHDLSLTSLQSSFSGLARSLSSSPIVLFLTSHFHSLCLYDNGHGRAFNPQYDVNFSLQPSYRLRLSSKSHLSNQFRHLLLPPHHTPSNSKNSCSVSQNN